MPSLRFFVVSILFTLPFFVFAQTATTTAEQPSQEASALQQQIEQLTASRINMLPQLTDIRSKAIYDYMDVKITPSNPGPNEKVRITIESYLTNLDKATISWYLDGIIAEQGVGKTSFTFQNGPSGKTTTLIVSILTNGGERITQKYFWTPVGITLLWEADTYTPPFYRGKALLSAQAWTKMVAFPDNTGSQNALSAGNFVYVWQKSGRAAPEASGYGKNTFSFVGPKPYDETNIKVRVSSTDDTINSESRVYLSLSDPFILFYEKNPLLGVWYNKTLGTGTTLNKKELSVSAEPYFFSNERGDAPSLRYTWSVNGEGVQNYGRTITLRNDTEKEGRSLLSLSMRGIKKTFQSATKDLQINFNESSKSSRPTF